MRMWVYLQTAGIGLQDQTNDSLHDKLALCTALSIIRALRAALPPLKHWLDTMPLAEKTVDNSSVTVLAGGPEPSQLENPYI